MQLHSLNVVCREDGQLCYIEVGQNVSEFLSS